MGQWITQETVSWEQGSGNLHSYKTLNTYYLFLLDNMPDSCSLESCLLILSILPAQKSPYLFHLVLRDLPCSLPIIEQLR